MSKIEELIKEKCPNGVQYKKLYEVTIWDKKFNNVDKNMQDITIKYNYLLANQLSEIEDVNGDVLILNTGINAEVKYTNKNLAGNNLHNGEIVCIPWGGTPNVKYYNGDFVTGDNRIATSYNFSILSNKFLYYFLNNNLDLISSFYRGSGIKHPEMKKILMMNIPIPPIEVQKEIVRILDKFSELEAELEAELEERKNQYEFWRDNIFNKASEKYESVELEKIIKSLKTGLNPRKNFMLNSEDAENYYITVAELNNGRIEFLDKTNRVNDEALRMINNRSNLEINDLLFSGTGTIGRMAVVQEKPTNWNIKEGVYVIKPKTDKVLPDYLRFYLSSSFAMKSYKNKIVGSPVCSLPMKDLKKLKIILPTIDEQKCIVTILDKFDKLTNSISKGIPAEIELRKKQYEYYRNKLLNFKEV